jgi:hypothetical protein
MAAIFRANVTRHLGLHAFVQQSHIEVAQRYRLTAGSGRGSLEDLFHLVILIQASDLLRFLGTLQLSIDIAALRAVVGLNAQATVGPQLSLAAESMRGLHQRDQARGSNGTDAGNLAQQLRGLMLPASVEKYPCSA